MKTAMQELISTFHLYQNSGCTQEEHELLSFYIKCAENLLKKEKEQIIDAYYDHIDGVYSYREAGERYYNQTYIENK
jgi:hypothetical protein